MAQKEVPKPYSSTLLKAADLFGSIDSLKEARESVHNQRSLSAIERLEAIYRVLKVSTGWRSMCPLTWVCSANTITTQE